MNWWRSYLVSGSILFVDQVTKLVALRVLIDDAMPVLPFLWFRYACNTGAAFSMFTGYGPVLTVVAFLFVIYFTREIWRLRHAEGTSAVLSLGMALILAGACGNLLDRLHHGCVIDFIHFHYQAFNFPIFNVADMSITFGAILWIYVIVKDMTANRAAAHKQQSRDSSNENSG